MADVMIMSEFEAVNVFVSVSGCCLLAVVLFLSIFSNQGVFVCHTA